MKRIFLDMDGVLADFTQGAALFHGKDPVSLNKWDGFEEEWGLTQDQFWSPLGCSFWAGLPLTPEAHEVVRLCEEAVGTDNVGIVTAPCKTEGCTEGKLIWIKKYFPQYEKRTFVGSHKHFLAHPRAMLVDDADYQCERFYRHGGWICLFPRVWNKAKEDAKDPLAVLRSKLKHFKDS